MKIAVFEDNLFQNLFPISVLRPVYEIKTGIFSNKERIEKFIGSNKKITLLCRQEMKKLQTEKYPDITVNKLADDDYIFLNGSVIFSFKLLGWIFDKLDKDTTIINENSIVVAKVSASNVKKIKSKLGKENPCNVFSRNELLGLNPNNKSAEKIKKTLSKEMCCLPLVYPWDALKHLDITLREDLNYFFESVKKLSVKKSYRYLKQKNVLLGKNVRIFPYAILDPGHSEIYIDDNSVIEPFTYIKGPAYIGKHCTVKSGTKIYGPVSIGEYSKISGEISGSIFHAYVNKQHDGFIGNSYFCEFVNIGADTVTSNLKNNYSKVSTIFNGKKFNTDMQFLGTIAGDHSKFGINTMLNTGTITGIFANIAGGGFPSKYIDSFLWYIIGKSPEKYKIDEALETAKIVMKRRDVKMSKSLEKYIRNYYDNL